MGGKSSGSSSSSGYSSGTSTTQLPDWLNAASQQAITQAQGIANTPYQAYGGQLVADPTAAQNAAYQSVWNMQGMNMPQWQQTISGYSNLLPQATPLTTQQIQGLTNQLYGGYEQNVLGPSAGLLGGYLQGGPTTAGQVGFNAQSLMSPYTQSVIQPAIQLGQQQLKQNLQGIGAAANQAGAFGGTRQGVEEGVAQAQTALGESQLVGNLLNTGWSNALTPATQIGLQAGSQGLTGATDLASLISGGYGTEQQAGVGMANTNLGLGMSALSALPGVLQGTQTAAQQQASLLQTVGAAQQQQQQAELNAQYGQFLTAQQYPYQTLDTLLSAVGSVPYGSTTQYSGYNMQQQNQQRNMMSGLMGGASTGAAIGSAFGPVGTGIGAAAGGILGAL